MWLLATILESAVMEGSIWVEFLLSLFSLLTFLFCRYVSEAWMALKYKEKVHSHLEACLLFYSKKKIGLTANDYNEPRSSNLLYL